MTNEMRGGRTNEEVLVSSERKVPIKGAKGVATSRVSHGVLRNQVATAVNDDLRKRLTDVETPALK